MQLNSSVTAVVTGGASGLGEATSRELAAAGVKVAIFDRDKGRGEKVAAEIKGVFCEVDVTSEESVIAGFKKAREALGQERILVNCAGTGIAIKTAARKKETKEVVPQPIEHFDRIDQINHVGTIR
ncbi:MAG: SDR family NAD(P)-dependent oxidoreductase, partial [Alphaproteobacteria bacterium]